MDRDKLIEKAKKWHFEHLPLEKDDWTPSERLAEFAAEVLAERDAEIADKLDAMAMQNFNGSWAHVILNLVDELRGKQIREALGK